MLTPQENFLLLTVTFICATWTLFSGVQGQYMGSDEKEVIYIAYQALNVTEKQVSTLPC